MSNFCHDAQKLFARFFSKHLVEGYMNHKIENNYRLLLKKGEYIYFSLSSLVSSFCVCSSSCLSLTCSSCKSCISCLVACNFENNCKRKHFGCDSDNQMKGGTESKELKTTTLHAKILLNTYLVPNPE